MRQTDSHFPTTPRRAIPVALALVALVAGALPATAQSSGSAQAPTSGSDRMFLNYFEEATVVDGQWWEGRIEYSDFDGYETTILRGVAAFAVTPDLEIGGTVGFGSSSTSAAGITDGTGATDLDVYAKYYFGSRDGRTEFAAGGNLTVPTGDDNAGLGYDAFGLGGFASLRYRLKKVILGGNLGFRLNGDGMIFGMPEANGKFSAIVGFGAIIPLADRLAVVAETRFETKRFDGVEPFLAVLAGVNWRVSNRGQIRAAIDFGLDDFAPDFRFVAGYAHTF